jgi:hypothetical protein
MFAGKAGAYPSEGPYPQMLDLAGKACQRPTLKLITNIRELWPNSFISLIPGANSIKLFTSVIYECSYWARVFVP